MRRGIDIGRLREIFSGPGTDHRCWICMGRIDDDPDATVWDDVLGWLCDVTAVSGPFAGSMLPLACRVVSMFQGVDVGEHNPPKKGGLVLVVFPSGDLNEDSIIIGYLHNTDDAGAPAEVNGTTIDEDFAERTFILVAPEHDLDQQWENVRITASGSMLLGTEDAEQPFVRGNDQADALAELVDAISTFASAIAVAPVNITGAVVALDPVSVTALETAIAQFKTARDNYLSTRIKGD